jgi:hypothetical protein
VPRLAPACDGGGARGSRPDDAHGAELRLEVVIKPGLREAADTEMPPDLPPAELGLLPGDEYILTSGGLERQRGFFTRDESGAVVGVDFAGRLFERRLRARSTGLAGR